MISFEEAVASARAIATPALLLGNGFSIACDDLFSYDSLFDAADFGNAPQTIERVFSHLGTTERVMSELRTAYNVASLYSSADPYKVELERDIRALRQLLIESLQGHHPGASTLILPDEYVTCARFLSQFESIFTTNYDLLLYWTLSTQPGMFRQFRDGFRRPTPAWILIWDGAIPNQNVFYLHGALHLIEGGPHVEKPAYRSTGVPLLEQIRNLPSNRSPLFVSAGTSEEKLATILANPYLRNGYQRLQNNARPLFVHGHSFSDRDNHIYAAIEHSPCPAVFASVMPDLSIPECGGLPTVLTSSNEAARPSACMMQAVSPSGDKTYAT